MTKVSVLVVGLCCIVGVQSRFVWFCPTVNLNPTIDPLQLIGQWYVYGVTPSRWGLCYNYTISSSTDNKYSIKEEHFRSIIHTKVTTDYDLEFNDKTSTDYNIMYFKKKMMYFIPTSVEWKIIGGSVGSNDSWMVLYRCSLLKEEAQIWVQNNGMYKENGDIPKEIQKVLGQINFESKNIVLREKSDCNH